MPLLAVHKKAFHEYTFLETLEAGLCLTGQEVKSVRLGSVNLKESFARIVKNELFLLNMHISPYRFAGKMPFYDPKRSRKLLIHTKELNRLTGKLNAQGLTLVPLRIYTKGTRIKIELGLGKGKKQYEKRDLLKKRAIEKDLRQYLKKY